MTSLSEKDLPVWALHAAHSAGLSGAVRAYPDQVIRAAAAARNSLSALEGDMSGLTQLSRPLWSLSK